MMLPGPVSCKMGVVGGGWIWYGLGAPSSSYFTFYINKTKRREKIFTLNKDDRDSKRDSPDR